MTYPINSNNKPEPDSVAAVTLQWSIIEPSVRPLISHNKRLIIVLIDADYLRSDVARHSVTGRRPVVC